MSVPTWATYRADCIPHKTGCRQCGCPLKSAFRAYCSHRCRRAFEMDHFWGTARNHAIYKADPSYSREAYIAEGSTGSSLWDKKPCAKCGELRPGETLEVNHIKPLNGNRPMFGCCHHQSNLEPLCHDCHVEETKRQRRAGEIGRPKIPHATPLLDEASA